MVPKAMPHQRGERGSSATLEEDEDMEDSFRFVRVGEDCDDTEQRGNGFPIYIKKSIEIY